MTRIVQRIAMTAVFYACAAAQVAQGETGDSSPASKVSNQLVEQKEAFVKRALYDSPAIRRIEASSNVEAMKLLIGAQENYRKALLLIRNNDMAGADRQLNEATRLIREARQLVPDVDIRSVEQRERFAQKLKSVESLQLSYQRHLQRVKGQPAGVAADDAQLAKVSELVESARNLSQSERVELGIRTLVHAEQVLMAGLSRILGSKSLEYKLHFETLVEEYAYELERNRSYADLIPIALAEFRPGSEAIREVQYLMDANSVQRDRAQRHAAEKNYRAALVALRSATAHAQSALAAAGLRVPQSQKP